jgi:membrane-associated phospholipid phosphatase
MCAKAVERMAGSDAPAPSMETAEETNDRRVVMLDVPTLRACGQEQGPWKHSGNIGKRRETRGNNPKNAAIAASNLLESAAVIRNIILSLLLAVAPALSVAAQDSSAHVDKTFFTKRDLVYTGAAVVGTVIVAQYDERIARWWQSPHVQGGSSLRNVVDKATHVNETPLTIAAIATYGIGRLAGSSTWADVGAHWTEAMVLTDVTSELIRGPVGRLRPRIVNDTNAFQFNPGKGFTNFGARSFPSLHSAAAYATAATLTAEIGERHGPVWIAGPILYTAAAIPGITRMYLDQHWASDIVSGAFVGILFGNKVVHYAHSHRRNRIDRLLLGTTVVPAGGGRFAVVSSFAP